jgi:ribosomal protein L29
MKKVDFKTKTAPELHKLLHDKREALRVFRFGISGSRTKNVKEGRNLRQEIARIMTVLKQAELK